MFILVLERVRVCCGHELVEIDFDSVFRSDKSGRLATVPRYASSSSHPVRLVLIRFQNPTIIVRGCDSHRDYPNKYKSRGELDICALTTFPPFPYFLRYHGLCILLRNLDAPQDLEEGPAQRCQPPENLPCNPYGRSLLANDIHHVQLLIHPMEL